MEYGIHFIIITPCNLTLLISTLNVYYKYVDIFFIYVESYFTFICRKKYKCV